jgi:hypothetical protein
MQPLFVEMEMAIVMGFVMLVCWSGGHIIANNHAKKCHPMSAQVSTMSLMTMAG